MEHGTSEKQSYAALDGAHHAFLQQAHLRMAMVTCVLMLGFAAIAWRLTSLSLIGVHSLPAVLQGGTHAGAQMRRAEILDRNGEVLATTLAMASLYADPSLVPNPEEVARDLAGILPVDPAAIERLLTRPGRFVWLYRHLTPQQQQAVNDLGHPGLDFRREYRRIYPQGALFSHILGYTDHDTHGISGLEKQYDALLSGGTPLKTVLDMRVQNILRRELADAVAYFNAAGGNGIVMQIDSGEIRAMVSLPDFDPHHPARAEDAARFNRNTAGVFEMGSTFKIFSIAAALERGAVTPEDIFDATHPLQRGRFRIHDFHPRRRKMTVGEIFLHSSNIGTALIAEKLGTEELREFYRKSGFLTRAAIDLPERAAPLVPRPWREINTLTASYGHGMAVTPLHVAVAAAGIVNDGMMPQASLTPQPRLPQRATERIVSPHISAIMREFMEETTQSGTGRNAAAEGYRVGGKTGTAEKVVDGRYKKGAVYSSFVGFFPMDNPQYVVVVSLDEPKGRPETHGYATGGWTAAPVVGKVIAQSAPFLGILPAHEAGEQQLYGSLSRYVAAQRFTHYAADTTQP